MRSFMRAQSSHAIAAVACALFSQASAFAQSARKVVAQCLSMETTDVRGTEVPSYELLIINSSPHSGQLLMPGGASVAFPRAKAVGEFVGLPQGVNQPLLAFGAGSGSTGVEVNVPFQMWFDGALGTMTIRDAEGSKELRVVCRPFRA